MEQHGNILIDLLEKHKIDFSIDSTTMNISNKNIVKEELKKIDNIFISNKPLKIESLNELQELKLILGLEYTHTSRELINKLKEYNVSIKPNIEIDTTELKVDAVKRGLGVGYVMRDAVSKELKNKEIYEVEIPIKLPTSSINLIYLKGQLTKADRKFIKEYLK